MPYAGDTYSLPAGTAAVSNTTANSAHTNSRFTDLEAAQNAARPIVAGGTGATSASAARTNLGLGTIATQGAGAVAITGGTIDGTAIGGSTPAAGAFTTLSASGATSVAALSASGVLSVASDIQHVGDTNNKIAFDTDTQSFETGGTSRLDISDSGVRMGATGARVTDIQTTITDSDTKLPTSGAVVDYVAAEIAAAPSGGWEFVSTIHDGGVDGTVSNVVTPDFAAGYDYLVVLEDTTSSVNDAVLQLEVYKTTDAAYESPFALFTDPSGSVPNRVSGEIYFPAPTTQRVLWSIPVQGAFSTTAGNGGILNSAWFYDATSQGLTRARLTFSAGSISGTSGTFIYFFRRTSAYP